MRAKVAFQLGIESWKKKLSDGDKKEGAMHQGIVIGKYTQQTAGWEPGFKEAVQRFCEGTALGNPFKPLLSRSLHWHCQHRDMHPPGHLLGDTAVENPFKNRYPFMDKHGECRAF